VQHGNGGGVMDDFMSAKATLAEIGKELDFMDVRTDLPVTVMSSDGTRLGYAVIEKESRAVTATVFLVYACPERLDIQAGKKLYLVPSVTFSGFGGLNVIRGVEDFRPTVMRVTSLTLTEHRPNEESTELVEIT
jgi:hypothetical protein